jgi:hypothetical protein
MLPHFRLLNTTSKSMVKRTSWKGVSAIAFLCFVTYVFAFAGAAEAGNLTITNPGTGSGSIDLWVNGIPHTPGKNLFPGEVWPVVPPVNTGDLIEIKNATPLGGSVFSGYSENNFNMPATDKTVDARFDLAYQLTVKITETGGSGGSHKVDVAWGTGSASCVAASCIYDIPQGATVTLTPHADGPNDWQFNGWTDPDVPAANQWDVPYVFTITGDFTAEADFSWTGLKKLTLDANGTGSGAVHVGTSPPGPGEAYTTSFPYVLSYWQGTVVYLTPYPDAGCVFVQWTGSGTDTADVPPKRQVTIAPGGDAVTVTFDKIQYNLTTSQVGGGAVTPSTTYVYDQGLAVSATPDPGWQFVNWTGDTANLVNPSAASTNLNNPLFTSTNITANFTVVDYQITATAGPNGSIAPIGVISPVNVQSPDQVFTITPDAGYAIADVLVNSASVGAVASYIFATGSITADQTIDASFVIIDYTLTISVGSGNGTVAPVSGTTYNYNTGLAVSAIPDAGWEFVNWTGAGAGNLVDANLASTTIKDPTYGDTVIAANFQKIIYTLTISVATGNGTVAPVTGTTYVYDDGLAISATPDAGWEFVDWMGETAKLVDPTAANTNIINPMDANTSVAANYLGSG